MNLSCCNELDVLARRGTRTALWLGEMVKSSGAETADGFVPVAQLVSERTPDKREVKGSIPFRYI